MRKCEDCGSNLDFEGYCPGQDTHKKIRDLTDWNIQLLKDHAELGDRIASLSAELAALKNRAVRCNTCGHDIDKDGACSICAKIASLQREAEELKGQLESQTAEIFQFHAVREILKRHGCTSDEDVVHVPHLVETFLQGLKGNRRPRIVCLCGSTRFKEYFDDANYHETMQGKIVLSVGFFMHASGNKHGEEIGATPEQKIALDELHKRKIDLADEVLILNVGGYIGESTRSELEYAKAHGKAIRYLEPPSEEE